MKYYSWTLSYYKFKIWQWSCHSGFDISARSFSSLVPRFFILHHRIETGSQNIRTQTNASCFITGFCPHTSPCPLVKKIKMVRRSTFLLRLKIKHNCWNERLVRQILHYRCWLFHVTVVLVSKLVGFKILKLVKSIGMSLKRWMAAWTTQPISHLSFPLVGPSLLTCPILQFKSHFFFKIEAINFFEVQKTLDLLWINQWLIDSSLQESLLSYYIRYFLI